MAAIVAAIEMTCRDPRRQRRPSSRNRPRRGASRVAGGPDQWPLAETVRGDPARSRDALERTSVSDDEVVFHEGAEVHRFDGLADTEHTLMGVEVRTLPRPDGELLCRFATVNEVHFGEEVCGIDETFGSEPVFRSEAGEPVIPR